MVKRTQINNFKEKLEDKIEGIKFFLNYLKKEFTPKIKFRGECAFCGKELDENSTKILIHHDEAFNTDYFDKYVCSKKCKKDLYKEAEKIWKNEFVSAKKYSKDYFCYNCKYLWTSKKQIGEPAFCPKCKRDNIIKHSHTEQWEKEYKDNKKDKIQIIASHYGPFYRN